MFVENESVSRWYSGFQYGLSDFESGHGAVLQPFDVQLKALTPLFKPLVARPRCIHTSTNTGMLTFCVTTDSVKI